MKSFPVARALGLGEREKVCRWARQQETKEEEEKEKENQSAASSLERSTPKSLLSFCRQRQVRLQTSTLHCSRHRLLCCHRHNARGLHACRHHMSYCILALRGQKDPPGSFLASPSWLHMEASSSTDRTQSFPWLARCIQRCPRHFCTSRLRTQHTPRRRVPCIQCRTSKPTTTHFLRARKSALGRQCTPKILQVPCTNRQGIRDNLHCRRIRYSLEHTRNREHQNCLAL